MIPVVAVGVSSHDGGPPHRQSVITPRRAREFGYKSLEPDARRAARRNEEAPCLRRPGDAKVS